ncbi:MAG: hypothetical protein KAR20_18865, partial [Candidatus Heimdallarchaeota archaeon]|nr:hypothetical protein [Candidatus Heimdallarchaeota archaeon]
GSNGNVSSNANRNGGSNGNVSSKKKKPNVLKRFANWATGVGKLGDLVEEVQDNQRDLVKRVDKVSHNVNVNRYRLNAQKKRLDDFDTACKNDNDGRKTLVKRVDMVVEVMKEHPVTKDLWAIKIAKQKVELEISTLECEEIELQLKWTDAKCVCIKADEEKKKFEIVNQDDTKSDAWKDLDKNVDDALKAKNEILNEITILQRKIELLKTTIEIEDQKCKREVATQQFILSRNAGYEGHIGHSHDRIKVLADSESVRNDTFHQKLDQYDAGFVEIVENVKESWNEKFQANVNDFEEKMIHMIQKMNERVSDSDVHIGVLREVAQKMHKTTTEHEEHINDLGIIRDDHVMTFQESQKQRNHVFREKMKSYDEGVKRTVEATTASLEVIGGDVDVHIANKLKEFEMKFNAMMKKLDSRDDRRGRTGHKVVYEKKRHSDAKSCSMDGLLVTPRYVPEEDEISLDDLDV